MSGPPPTPTKLRMLRGNPRHRPLPVGEPQPMQGDIKRPSHLKGRARIFWKRHEPLLKGMEVLTTADVDLLAALCETEAEYWDARDDVRERGVNIEATRLTPKGDPYTVTTVNPSVGIASDAAKRLKALMCEFGMSPASRTRISVNTKAKEEDPFAKFERKA